MQVELVAFTPSPEAVCDLGARVCVSKDIPEPDEDLRALGHALESGHESVLEHASFSFAIEGISRACSHQLVRHRMASYSQQSQRYVKAPYVDVRFVTPISISQNTKLIDGVSKPPGQVNYEYLQLMRLIGRMYEQMIDAGIPEEDARYILPNACYTNLVVTMNARELRHFFSLRCCERAQWEIKELAEKMLGLVKEVAPTLFEDAGPRCKALGYCPEKRGCGKMPKKVVE